MLCVRYNTKTRTSNSANLEARRQYLECPSNRQTAILLLRLVQYAVRASILFDIIKEVVEDELVKYGVFSLGTENRLEDEWWSPIRVALRG